MGDQGNARHTVREALAIKAIESIKATPRAGEDWIFFLPNLVNNLIFRHWWIGFNGFYGFNQIGNPPFPPPDGPRAAYMGQEPDGVG
jgi:hypothetical protein